MNDCIHLHACRRIQSIGRTNRLNCTEDCEAYQSKKEKTDYVSIREALDFAAEGGRWVEDYGTDGAFDINDLLVVRASVGEILENTFGKLGDEKCEKRK